MYDEIWFLEFASVDPQGDMGYTCETAGYFYHYNVFARWEAYLNKVKAFGGSEGDVKAVAAEFPFTQFFASAPQPLFKVWTQYIIICRLYLRIWLFIYILTLQGESFEADIDVAEGCFRHLRKIFDELESFRAFEIMRTGPDRIDYLLQKEAKIIAMTCTHAALKRSDVCAICVCSFYRSQKAV